MGLFDRFPWVNTHELNLDWIIQKMKEWGKESAENVAAARTAAEKAEPFAARAETAANNAMTAERNAGESRTAAESSATKAGSSATKAEKAFKAATLSADGAATSARAAAASAEEARNVTKWPYSGIYKGYLYKTLDSTDSYTNSNREFLNAPQDNGTLFRVSGNIPKRCSINDSTNYEYHYEKIIKMTGNAGASLITFGDGFNTSIPGLVIAEAEPIGLVLFLNSDNSFYKYSSLPLVSMNVSNQFIVDSKGFEIPDDNAANIQISLQNEGLSPSEVTAYLYVRIKYTF